MAELPTFTESRADPHQAASSLARSQERRDLESTAIARCLGQMLRQLHEKNDFVRVKVLEVDRQGRVRLSMRNVDAA